MSSAGSGTMRIELDSGYQVCVNEFLPGPDCHIFNLPKYFRLHAPHGGFYCQLVRQSEKKACAVLHFTETSPQIFRSPARGTFGGLSARDDVPLESLEGFVGAVEQRVCIAAAGRFEILLPPASHDAALFAKSFNVFSRLGFMVHTQELNYDLIVDPRPLSERMESGNRKRLNKCTREGMVARRLDVPEYEQAYGVIVQNRGRCGYPVTMSLADIMEMADLFPERVRCFAVFQGERMVAASICIAVHAAILYVFYWGDVDDMQQHSPVVMLAAEIYGHCQREGYRILDVGTATTSGVPNHGLIRFKRSLGFSESLKLTLAKGTASDA